MRAIGIHDQVLGEEPLETLPHRLHADPEPSREGFGLRLTEALQLEQNGVDRRLHAASLRNIARLCLLNIGPPCQRQTFEAESGSWHHAGGLGDPNTAMGRYRKAVADLTIPERATSRASPRNTPPVVAARRPVPAVAPNAAMAAFAGPIDAMGRAAGTWQLRRCINRWSAAMPQPNDLSRSLVVLDHNSTIIAVV